jgi:hypothetical protein
VDTYTERQAFTPSVLVPSPMGRKSRDGTFESLNDTLPSELRETRERYNANSQNISPAIVPFTQVESRLAAIESQPSHPSTKADAQIESENLPSRAAPSAPPAVGHSSNHNETLAQNEPAAGSISTAPNHEHPDTGESRALAGSCEDSGQYGQGEPDYGQIVRDLHRLKQKRKMQEQKIEAGHNSLPDVSRLTQSASEAQRAADEAQRVADEAQRAAETAKKAVEDAQAKQSQLTADELYLEKLTQDSRILRAQLDID